MPILTPGKLDKRRVRNSRQDRGMTLIEILVSMAIVGIMFALALSGMRTMFSTNLKSSSARVASLFRYLANKAVTDHVYLKMTYQLEGGKITLSQSEEPFIIDPDMTSDNDKKNKKVGSEEEQEKEKFTESDSSLMKPYQFPSDVKFKDVMVSYSKDKFASGEVSTFFFPNGYATATMVNITDADGDTVYSIELLPFSGRVKIEGSYRELESK